MANSRLEKLGTIFSRVTSLMKCGAMKRDEKPIWYEVYQTYPPLNEPTYARRIPFKEIKPILYPEDRIRANFHKGFYAQTSAVQNLSDEATTDTTRRVISLTYQFMESDGSLSEEEALKKSVDKLLEEKELALKTSKSIFKSNRRKARSVLTESELVDVPKHVGDLKTISQKDVDVDSILNKEAEPYVDTVAENFKESSKNMSNKKIDEDNPHEEK